MLSHDTEKEVSEITTFSHGAEDSSKCLRAWPRDRGVLCHGRGLPPGQAAGLHTLTNHYGDTAHLPPTDPSNMVYCWRMSNEDGWRHSPPQAVIRVCLTPFQTRSEQVTTWLVLISPSQKASLG